MDPNAVNPYPVQGPRPSLLVGEACVGSALLWTRGRGSTTDGAVVKTLNFLQLFVLTDEMRHNCNGSTN